MATLELFETKLGLTREQIILLLATAAMLAASSIGPALGGDEVAGAVPH